MIRQIVGVTLIAGSLLAAGCATKGRMSVVDVDFRDASQIEAGRFEAAVPYATGTTNVPTVVKTESIPPALWGPLMELLKVIKCRIRILSVEWDERGAGS